jgi:hypothetical protein
MDEEGMINVWVDLQKQLASMTHGQDEVKDLKERSIDHEGYDKCPPLNIVIFIVGSRGEQSSTSSASKAKIQVMYSRTCHSPYILSSHTLTE